MVNTCIMCGNTAELPEGKYVCFRCENGWDDNKVLCPQCGTVLEVMSSHWYQTCDGHARNTIFHCNECHSDWEKDEEFRADTVRFTRKVWG